MSERQKRLIEVYDHLRRFFGVHTKTGFAEAIHFGRTSLSAAMNGNEDYLTDNLFKTICDSYKGVFNLDYLLNGNGSLLIKKEDVFQKQSDSSQPTSVPTFEFSILIENAVKAATAYANRTIATLEKQVSDKDAQIEDLRRDIIQRDKTIEIQARRIQELESYTNQHIDEDVVSKWPFKIGVADERQLPKEQV